LLADLTGNPAMRLFVQMITRVLGDLTPRARSLPAVASTVHAAHAKIAEAVVAGDADTARRRMARHLGSVMEYFDTGGVPTRRPGPSTAVRRARIAG
jgi:DNA-binding FadR family transcriptional regulator